ncbi:MAG: hypothetical protein LIO59_04050, partial [Oscillospiraceae bacterium]|nr:hypothetical protein [Oscillospiraceae bacterium]
IVSGLSERDMVRTLNTESSSANASFGSGESEEMQQMNGMMGGGMSGGGMGGGIFGGGGGGMPGGR